MDEGWRYSFEAFAEGVGERPSSKHSLERVENDKGYVPGNVVWATSMEQSRNKRTNVWIEFRGVRRLLLDWAIGLGVSPDALRERIRRGWSLERALTEPLNKSRSHRSLVRVTA